MIRTAAVTGSVQLPTSTRPVGSGYIVDPIAQFLAGLEMRHVLARKRDKFAGFWISPDTRRSEMKRKTAKSPYFDALPRCQRLTHLFDHAFYR